MLTNDSPCQRFPKHRKKPTLNLRSKKGNSRRQSITGLRSRRPHIPPSGAGALGGTSDNLTLFLQHTFHLGLFLHLLPHLERR